MSGVFNGLDWVILGVVCFLVVAGLWKGLVRLVFAVLSVVAAAVKKRLTTGLGTQALTPLTRNPALAAVASFIIAFVVVLILMGFLGRLLSRAIHLLGLGWVDRLGGAILGLAGAALVVGALFLVLGLAGMEQNDWVRDSALAPYGNEIADLLDGVFPEDIRDMIEKRRKDFEEMEKRLEEGQRRLEELPPEVRERISEEI